MGESILSRVSRLVGTLRRRARVWGDPDEDDDDDFGLGDLGLSTPSGVKLTRRKAYSVSSWYRAINLLSGTVAKTPIDCFDLEAGDNRIDGSHAVSRLFGGHGQPNAETLRVHFLQTLTAHAIGHGGGFGYIYRDKRGEADEVLQLRPDRTYPVRENGRLLYITTIGGELGDGRAEVVKMLPENVLHIHGLGFDGLEGYSLMRMASRALGASVAKEEFASRYFKNGLTPSVGIKVAKKLSPKAYKALERSWTKLRTGLENSHKAVILEEGAEVVPFSHSAVESQLVEAQARDPLLVSNFTGVPPYLLGVPGYNSNASLEVSSQDFLDFAADPWFIPWEQELAAKFLKEREKERYLRTVLFRRSALIRVDHAKRMAGNRTALGGHPYKEVNEVRREEGLQARPKYDFIPSPLNMSAGGKPDAGTAGDAVDSGDAQAGRAAVRAIAETTVKRMVSRLHGVATRGGALAEHTAVITDALGPLVVLASAGKAARSAGDISAEMVRSAGQAAADGKLSEWERTTAERVLGILFAGSKS